MPHILVADDNPISLRFLEEALNQLGASCVLAEDGIVAVRSAKVERFDLLLFDANMPNLGGIGALEVIRSGSGLSKQSIAVATTAASETAAHEHLLASGFSAILSKPLTIAELQSVLTRYLPCTLGATRSQTSLDDASALAAVGGDRTILNALRELLAAELTRLPDEMEELTGASDVPVLCDRLHRLEASAGFCGASALSEAIITLRASIDSDLRAPSPEAIAAFLAVVTATEKSLTTPRSG
ncbi:MAG: response regulator [Dokdonella sp.]